MIRMLEHKNYYSVLTNTSNLKDILLQEYRWSGEDEQGLFECSVDLWAIAPSQESRLL